MGGALAAFQRSSPRAPTSMASAAAKLHATTSKATASDNTKAAAAIPQASAADANQHNATSEKVAAVEAAAAAAVAPVEGSAVGSGGELGTKLSSTGGYGPGQTTAASGAATSSGDIANAAGAAASPEAAEKGASTATTTATAPSLAVPGRKPNAMGSRGRFSTMSRVVKSFPGNGNGRRESLQAGAQDCAASVARTAAAATAAANSPEGQQQTEGVARQPQELTPTQAAVLAADNKLEGLLNVGGIIRARSGWECPHGFPQGTPVWDSAEGTVGGGGRRRSWNGREGVGSGLDGGVDVNRGGRCPGLEYDAVVAGDDAGKAVVEWASRFCEPENGFPANDSEEGVRLGTALARHVVRDGDAGLIGTRCTTRTKPPTSCLYFLILDFEPIFRSSSYLKV